MLSLSAQARRWPAGIPAGVSLRVPKYPSWLNHSFDRALIRSSRYHRLCMVEVITVTASSKLATKALQSVSANDRRDTRETRMSKISPSFIAALDYIFDVIMEQRPRYRASDIFKHFVSGIQYRSYFLRRPTTLRSSAMWACEASSWDFMHACGDNNGLAALAIILAIIDVSMVVISLLPSFLFTRLWRFSFITAHRLAYFRRYKLPRLFTGMICNSRSPEFNGLSSILPELWPRRHFIIWF